MNYTTKKYLYFILTQLNININVTIPKRELYEILEHVRKIEYKKGQIILSRNKVEKKISFVVEGLVHQYDTFDGKVMTTNIVLPGMMFSNFTSYSSQAPSEQIQEAITDAVIIHINKIHLNRLFEKYSSVLKIYLNKFEQIHLATEIRSKILQYESADKRFELFMEKDVKADSYLNLVPHKYIARYLGLTPETFSRTKTRFTTTNVKT